MTAVSLTSKIAGVNIKGVLSDRLQAVGRSHDGGPTYLIPAVRVFQGENVIFRIL